jgi:hypothetical protein
VLKNSQLMSSTLADLACGLDVPASWTCRHTMGHTGV